MPLAGTLKSAFPPALGDVADATAGLGGIECAVLFPLAGPLAAGLRDAKVGVVCASPTRVSSGCKFGVPDALPSPPAPPTAGSGSTRSCIGTSGTSGAGPVEPDLLMFMSDDGVTGALAARDCGVVWFGSPAGGCTWPLLWGVRYGEWPAELERGAAGGGMPWRSASSNGSGDSDSDSDVVREWECGSLSACAGAMPAAADLSDGASKWAEAADRFRRRCPRMAGDWRTALEAAALADVPPVVPAVEVDFRFDFFAGGVAKLFSNVVSNVISIGEMVSDWSERAGR